jgi:hypothetical protein
VQTNRVVEVFVAKRAYIADVIKDEFCKLGFLLREGDGDVDETEVEEVVLREPSTIFVEAESASLPSERRPVKPVSEPAKWLAWAHRYTDPIDSMRGPVPRCAVRKFVE